MQKRKDNRGRVLKDGETFRKSDKLYMYRWTAKDGKRHTIYDATLEGLREKEEQIKHDLRAVSYTHLDVYKRQGFVSCGSR